MIPHINFSILYSILKAICRHPYHFSSHLFRESNQRGDEHVLRSISHWGQTSIPSLVNTVSCYVVLNYFILRLDCTVLCHSKIYCPTIHHPILYHTIMYRNVLYHSALCCTQSYFTLYCTVEYSTGTIAGCCCVVRFDAFTWRSLTMW